MNITIDTHTHTLASGHAYCSLKEMAQTAAAKGLEGLCITEHAPALPGGAHQFYFENLRVVPRELYGLELLLGVELNILNEAGDVDLPEAVLAQLDIRIASIHRPTYSGGRTAAAVTAAYTAAMQNPDIDIIGHPDDGRYPLDYEELARAAKETGTLLEVNNSSLHPKSYRQNSRENIRALLSACRRQEVMVTFATDAHYDQSIGEYPYALALAAEVDFPAALVANTSLAKLKSSLKRWK